MGLDQPDLLGHPTMYIVFSERILFRFYLLFPILILCSGIRAIDKRFWLLHHNYKNIRNIREVLILCITNLEREPHYFQNALLSYYLPKDYDTIIHTLRLLGITRAGPASVTVSSNF